MASAVLSSPNELFWRDNNDKANSLAEFGYGGYTTVNLAGRSRSELRELRKRLVSELGQIQNLRNWVESEYPTARPEKKGVKQKNGSGLKRRNPDQSRELAGAAKAQLPGMEKVVGSSMRRCGQILGKLMKHKFGWVFNVPVDVKGLGLHDYYQVIKQPMDLGTVKGKLGAGGYGSPLEFADDVRLTFNNALRYNPEGQDVHFMAGQMLKVFEDLFAPAYKKFEDEMRKLIGNLGGMAMQSKKRRVLDQGPMEIVSRGPVAGGIDTVAIAKKSETVRGHSSFVNSALAPVRAPSPAPIRVPSPAPIRAPSPLPVHAPSPIPSPAPTPAPQVLSKPVVSSRKLPKPKARDPNKRGMTMEEKARLGYSLQELPEDKMSQLLSIIRKRNQHLAHDRDDEIELDIEAVDIETLWELDRFVSNYKKLASKIRRQGLIHNPVSPGQLNKSPVSEVLEATTSKGRKGDVGEEDVDIGEDMPMNNFPPVEIEKDGTGCATSSSSSSSSSSSDSSSSDSDNGSSSGSDSDADSVRSPYVESKEGNGV